MINEKAYLKLIKHLPLVKCPDSVISQIINTCDIHTQSKKNYSASLREIAYGIGCVIIIAVIFMMCKYSYDNHQEYHTCIAVNSHLLVRQLANGASIIFTEKIK